MKTVFLSLVFSTLLLATPVKKAGYDWSAVGSIAIQDRGRVKPMDTFANETMAFMTGKSKWKDLNALESVFGILFQFDKEWIDEPFIRVDYGPLKKTLGLSMTEHFFSPRVVGENTELPKIIREAMKKEQRKEKLSDLEKKAVTLQNQRGLLDALVSGQALAIFPNPGNINDSWFSLAQLSERGNLPYDGATQQKLAVSVKGLIDSYMSGNAQTWNQASSDFASVLRNDLAKSSYPTVSELNREIHYNHLRPFRWSWVLYTIAFIFMVSFLVSGNKIARYVGAGSLVAAFLLHAYGFTLRCLIAGRPPVSNMYESVIWVTWGCVLFALLIWMAYKKAAIPTAATVFAVVGLVLADNVPLVLDPSIHPLEPVLRSNYWLTIHVLTITLSYAAFALSLCLGNVVLGNYLFRPNQTAVIQNYSLYMYRAMQIGVVLLAAGTILGGVWADYSWGRFWGWDPKEVWALIALLLYIAVLHGRFTGWLKGFGFVATTVVSFLGVLMAWYGVNFVLGVGLHSYGFGSGGMSYVAAYVAVQVGFILLAYRQLQKAKAKDPSVEGSIFPRAK